MDRAQRRRLRDSTWAGVAAAAAAVTAVTLLLYPLQQVDPGVSSGVLYVLGVLVITVTWGARLGFITSVVSALALWVFHTSPTAGFSGIEADDIAGIFVLLIVEVVAVVIADRARVRIQDAEERLALEAELREREVERARLEEITASRARVLAAGDAERKRVVRDLHDGAQQRLVHTVIRLKLTQRALESGDADQGLTLASDALVHAESAVTELRELAHGILPAALMRGGLPAGLEALADRMEIPVALDVADERFSPTVEATAYFVVAEALTNVAKHAHATRAEATAWLDGDCLRVRVADDGRGGIDGDGTGMTGLRDRLAVLDGELVVGERDGGGAVVEAAIPLV